MSSEAKADDGGAAAGAAGAGAGAPDKPHESQVSQAKQYWNDFADDYERIAWDWSSPMGYTLLSMLPVRTCGRLLELGCGPGNVTELAHSMMPPSSTIVAYDISERMVDKTAARFRGKDGPTVEARVGDVQLVEGCEPGSFDGVVSNLCIFMCEDTEATLARMLEVLVPGGRAVFSVWGRPAESLLFSLVGKVAAEEGIDLYVGSPAGRRSAFHMGQEGAAKLRERVLKAGFSKVLAWHHVVPMPFTSGEDAANFSLTEHKRNRDAVQKLRDTGRGEEADRLVSAVTAAAQRWLDSGKPYALDAVLCVAQK